MRLPTNESYNDIFANMVLGGKGYYGVLQEEDYGVGESALPLLLAVLRLICNPFAVNLLPF